MHKPRVPTSRVPKAFVAVALAFLLAGSAAAQEASASLRVTVTNTSPQVISPPVLVHHTGAFVPFAVGAPASPELARLAEDGDASELATVARVSDGVIAVTVADGPLMPGESVTLEIDTGGEGHYLTLLGMLVTTNDAFVAWTASVADFTMMADAAMGMMAMGPAFADGVVRVFDAGSEANTESCAHVPGPPCGSADARVTEGAEGVVALHGGLLGVADLDPMVVGWLHPVVSIAPGM